MTTSPGASPPRRFFFVHVQKTAGTSLLIRLGHQFPSSAIYPDESDGDKFDEMPQFDVPQLEARWAVRRDEIEVVTGHFPLCTAELLGGGFTTFTVLREPVERTLSYLRHHRKFEKGSRTLTLEEIYADPLRFDGLVHNHMVKMFSLTVAEMIGGAMTKVDFDRGHLERAKAGLRRVDVIGLQEDFDAFVTDLEQRFGWDLGPPVFANHTDPADASDELRARIARDNALDIEFFAFARTLVAERATG
jgi:hypothetical protein